ncbi:MAG: hypothetical protein HYT22_02465 [Candidatus Niyogibacteria bacterium]|nr:hypothetical protein [Candidatus Niyogibacteria bacterium]
MKNAILGNSMKKSLMLLVVGVYFFFFTFPVMATEKTDNGFMALEFFASSQTRQEGHGKSGTEPEGVALGFSSPPFVDDRLAITIGYIGMGVRFENDLTTPDGRKWKSASINGIEGGIRWIVGGPNSAVGLLLGGIWASACGVAHQEEGCVTSGNAHGFRIGIQVKPIIFSYRQIDMNIGGLGNVVIQTESIGIVLARF